MKTYSVFMRDGKIRLNEYIRGRINGVIYVLTGMPEKRYPSDVKEDGSCAFQYFDATEAQFEMVRNCVEKLYGHFIYLEFKCRETQEEEL